MSSTPGPEAISRDATWLTQALDPSAGTVRLVAMTADSYRSASFLDDRMLSSKSQTSLAQWSTIEKAMEADLRSDARWIFHIGHVGSTLISRLLGELDGVLAVREPKLLRDLALTPPETRRPYLPFVPKLMSRTFDAGQTACVKATSFVSTIAADLVPNGEGAFFLFASPRRYIASILAGENSVKELYALAPLRDQRLATYGIALPAARTDADRAAKAWACEMITLESAADRMSCCHIEWADFDAMLSDMAVALGRITASLGLATTPAQLEAIANGPLMGRYSKALEYEYSAMLRAELIAEASARHGPEIDAALAMLTQAAEQSPLLMSALKRSQREG